MHGSRSKIASKKISSGSVAWMELIPALKVKLKNRRKHKSLFEKYNGSTNTQVIKYLLYHSLSHSPYTFERYCVIFRQLAISA
jgi:hypothetical protein